MKGKCAIALEGGHAVTELTVTGTCGHRNNDTSVHFWLILNTSIALSFRFYVLSITCARKQMFCPGLEITFIDKVGGEEHKWYYEDGLKDYLAEGVRDTPYCLKNRMLASS